MKKYLLGLLALPIMSPLLSIASADSLDGFTSDGVICKYSETTDYLEDSTFINGATCSSTVEHLNGDYVKSVCFVTSSLPYLLDGGYGYDYGNKTNVTTSPYCINGYQVSDDGFSFYENDETLLTIPMTIYFSPSTITPPSSNSGGGSSDSILPELSVPSSFTSGITQLVNNFGSTISEWIPIVILVTLGITAIFALFRVVRNYARRSFKG